MRIAVALLGAVAVTSAQEAPPQDQGGWRRLGNPTANETAPAGQNGPAYNGPSYNDPLPAPPLPATLTIAPGTFFTVRVNQPLSSNRNQVGDPFTASLVKPIVVNGIIVADRGQTIAGRVAEVDKGGRIKGLSKLGIELTELTLVTGEQVPVHSQLISHTAPGSVGRDATAVGATTAVGAVIGAAAQGGRGAAIGAGAGAAAGIIGVLLTKGYPTVIHPESVLTFRVESPVVVATDRAPQAFRYVAPGDYSQPAEQPRLARRPPPPYYGPGYYGPYWGPYYYGWGYPYYYGPGVAIGFGYGRYGRWR
ncbi:MAG TPA: hypothetical protein VGR73_18390 [Bryobacteraceae bacterium]|nr:hypothetical protein [Bryobacteraceae bacterium]